MGGFLGIGGHPPPPEPPSHDGVYLLFVIAVLVIGLAGSKPSLAEHWRQEFVGAAIIVALAFTPGKWFATGGEPLFGVLKSDWLFHGTGVVLADWTLGGPHLNPGVSLSFWLLGKIDGARCAVVIIAQTAGACVGVHLCQAFAAARGWPAIGGPEVAPTLSGEALVEAMKDEFVSMLLLMFAIYLLNFEVPDKFANHWSYYILKQSATAAFIRLLIESFPSSGPAFNPALATGWLVADTGALPPLISAHCAVYWLAPCLGAVVASVAYALYTPKAAILGQALRKEKTA